MGDGGERERSSKKKASEKSGQTEDTREANGQKLKKQKGSRKGDQDQGKRKHGIREVRVLDETKKVCRGRERHKRARDRESKVGQTVTQYGVGLLRPLHQPQPPSLPWVTLVIFPGGPQDLRDICLPNNLHFISNN